MLDRAIGLEANEYRFHYALAQARYHAGDSDKALASLERARELAPAEQLETPLTLPDGG